MLLDRTMSRKDNPSTTYVNIEILKHYFTSLRQEFVCLEYLNVNGLLVTRQIDNTSPEEYLADTESDSLRI